MPARLLSGRIIFSAILSVLALSSCKKDKADNPGVDPTPVVEKKISKVFKDNKNFLEFDYDANGRLSKMKIAEEELEGGIQTMDIFYNANNRIKTLATNMGVNIEFTYENNRLSRTETKLGNGEIEVSGSYTYENGNLVDYGIFGPFPLDDGEDGVVFKRIQETKYQYNADKSISSLKSYLLNPFSKKLEFAGEHKYEKYDNKINPMKNLADLSYGFFQEYNPSNVLKELVYDEGGVLTETIERTFTYDNAGYPLTCKETTTEAGKAAVIKTLTFSYK